MDRRHPVDAPDLFLGRARDARNVFSKNVDNRKPCLTFDGEPLGVIFGERSNRDFSRVDPDQRLSGRDDSEEARELANVSETIVCYLKTSTWKPNYPGDKVEKTMWKLFCNFGGRARRLPLPASGHVRHCGHPSGQHRGTLSSIDL